MCTSITVLQLHWLHSYLVTEHLVTLQHSTVRRLQASIDNLSRSTVYGELSTLYVRLRLQRLDHKSIDLYLFLKTVYF